MRAAIQHARGYPTMSVVEALCLDDMVVEIRRMDGLWMVSLMPHGHKWPGAYGEHPSDSREALMLAVEEMVSSSTPSGEGRAQAP